MNFVEKRELIIALIGLGLAVIVGFRTVRYLKKEGLIPFLWLLTVAFTLAGAGVWIAGESVTGAILLVGALIALIGAGVLEFLRRIDSK